MPRAYKLCLPIMLMAAACFCTITYAMPETIYVGGLIDTSGATADIGKDYALGLEEAFNYINDQGGVNGKQIKFIWSDYGYRIPEALMKYALLKMHGAVAVMGWGAGDTEALSPTITRDKIPYISASYSSHLTDPKKTPYNLFVATDYSTNARAAITAWFDKKWPKHKDYGKRRPRFVCAYMAASPFCSAPIRAIKEQAEILGFDIGPDQFISLFAIDTKNHILAMKHFMPDLVWHGNTTLSVVAALRDAYTLGLKADHIVNNWGFDENLPKLAGKASEGVMGAAVCAFFGENVRGMNKVIQYAKKCNPGIYLEKRLNRTVQAWSNALILWEALKRADRAGNLTGENILKNGFETLRNFDIGLGVSPVTYTSKDHRISGIVPIYEIRYGKFQLIEKVNLKSRWPSKWRSEWLGW